MRCICTLALPCGNLLGCPCPLMELRVISNSFALTKEALTDTFARAFVCCCYMNLIVLY